jgi:hypothetical protein
METSVKFEVFTVVAMNNVFWDKRAKFVPHRRHLALHYRAQPVNAM